MRNWDYRDEEGNDRVCTQGEDYKEAKKVAEFLDIPFHEVDFIEDYWNDVFSPFLDAYEEVLFFLSHFFIFSLILSFCHGKKRARRQTRMCSATGTLSLTSLETMC